MSYAVGAALYNKILQLIILPTEKCNFRCTYCYEDFEIGKMSRETIDALKALIAARVERTGLEWLSLSWFGGEPLLARDVVYELSEFANELVGGGGLKGVSGDLTTNAYLLDDETLGRLIKAKQNSFQISLDGYGAGHDKTRRYINGSGTFDRIWANLLSAKASKHEFSITLRCHQTRENESSMVELVEQVSKTFAGDSRFNVFFKSIENLGGPNTKDLKKMETSVAETRVKKLQEILDAANLTSSAVLDGPESATGKQNIVGAGSKLEEFEGRTPADAPAKKGLAAYEGYICYAAKPNSLMIRADGTIGKCTVLMNDPRNRVGQLNADGTVTLDSEKISRVWMRGFVSEKPMELGCPAQGLPRLTKETPVEFVS